ncbi:MAG: hypothetical protein FJ240_12300 [Nitrospira sp.]|nr:hypothetical protein [Nitrospira sp.]
MRKRKLFIISQKALLVLLIFVIVFPSGCGSNGQANPEPQPIREGGGYSSILQSLLSGIAKGAGNQIGGDVMGLILSELGWGNSGNNTEVDALNNMASMLQTIISQLNDIENKLDALFVQLDITKEEIIANTNDPTAAITQINTFHSNLSLMVQGKSPGSANKQDMLNFANNVEFNYQIENDVNLIHDAILPPTIAKKPVIDNFTDLALNNIKAKGVDPVAAYDGIEKYFSQLLFYQLKGANLVVEAKNAKQKAGTPDPVDAKTYWDGYIKNTYQPEVDNFVTNIYRLILSRVDLVNTSSFLPADATRILARLNFFLLQTLNQDHYGLRVTLIGTQDLVNSVVPMNAKNKGTGQIYSGTGTLKTLSGPTYDYWSGNNVKSSSNYTLITYDFGNVPVGNYDILDGTNNVIGSATVQTYKDDYTLDPTGTIHYGHVVIPKRVGAKDAFYNNVHWNWWSANLKNTGANGNASVKWTGLSGSAQSSSYHGDDELQTIFVFAGDKSYPLTVHYSVQANGSTTAHVSSATGGVSSYIYYRVGLWDATTNAAVNVFKTNHVTASCSNYQSGQSCNNTKSIGDNVQGSFVFPNPSPGHTYYIFFNCHIDGGSDSYGTTSPSGNIKLDSIAGNIYISF